MWSMDKPLCVGCRGGGSDMVGRCLPVICDLVAAVSPALRASRVALVRFLVEANDATDFGPMYSWPILFITDLVVFVDFGCVVPNEVTDLGPVNLRTFPLDFNDPLAVGGCEVPDEKDFGLPPANL